VPCTSASFASSASRTQRQANSGIINDVFRDPAERARAIGAWAATIGLGVAIGPIADGLLLARFWWGSVFLVNVPIVVARLAGALVLVLVPDSKNPAAGRPDPWGAVLSIAGLGLLLWAIIEGPAQGWASGEVVGAGLASLVVVGTLRSGALVSGGELRRYDPGPGARPERVPRGRP